jgi:tetratricopeptide (TPR) repeat protein
MFSGMFRKMLLLPGDRMTRTQRAPVLICILVISFMQTAHGQETVFSLLKNDIRLADEYYRDKNYKTALKLYSSHYRKNSASGDVRVKIARCYYFLKDYKRAVSAFEYYVRTHPALAVEDLFYYAESQASAGNYKKAVDAYREYLRRKPDDPVVTQKIWRLNNIQYLYEDSLHYAVRPVTLNTASGELCPVPYGKGLVFISNRREVQVVEKTDASLNAPFYRTYFSLTSKDTAHGLLLYGKPGIFNKGLNSGFHAGPVAFYQKEKRMVFASTGEDAHENGSRTLHLYFAALEDGDWKVTGSFPYNSTKYSITDPAITADGKFLYFASDMPGGYGGKDLYRSTWQNDQWSKPENLGETINTSLDEVFPYLHLNKTFYFSSTGHPGLGGLDIFKVLLSEKGFDEVLNAGYPINSNGDEFGIIIDSLSAHGYFSSNRRKGGYDDDIYEFDVDLQTYPLEISGLIRFKEHNWSHTLELKPMINAKCYLVDNIKDAVVYESKSDSTGNFLLVIPYFSKYSIKVIGADSDEHVVSMEIPKQRKLHNKHEIVIVKDAFRSPENQRIK